MPDNSDIAELIQHRLEQWDDPTRGPEGWIDDPGARRALAGQRAIDLALRARAGCDISHRTVRDRVVATVREQAAPRAVRDAILAQVHAEATRGSAWSTLQRWREAFTGRMTWQAGATAMCLLALLIGITVWRQPKPQESSPILGEIIAWSGQVQIVFGQERLSLTAGQPYHGGQQLWIGSNGSASLVLRGRTRLELGANSVLTGSNHADGIIAYLDRGVMSIRHAPTNPLQSLSVQTRHLRATTDGAHFTVDSSGEISRLHSIEGELSVTRPQALASAMVRKDEMVEARHSDPAGSALVPAPYARRISDWPFHSNSPWNTSIGSGALLARITAPQWPPQSLSNAVIIRPILFSNPTDPRRNFLSPGEDSRRIRYPDWWQPAGTPREIVCVLFMNDGLCCEMTEPLRLPSQDIRVRERNSTDLFGSGVGWSWPRPRTIGGSAFAGLIRRGELTFGIPHALALAVHPKYLNSTRGTGGHVWPGIPVAPENVEQFGQEGNLAIGSQLVLSPRTNIAALGIGTSGPGYEIARALQDYGAYIIQTTEAPLQIIASGDAGLPPNIDAILTRLIPHLRLVSNNSLRNVGGGGKRSRPPAPPFSEE